MKPAGGDEGVPPGPYTRNVVSFSAFSDDALKAALFKTQTPRTWPGCVKTMSVGGTGGLSCMAGVACGFRGYSYTQTGLRHHRLASALL